MPHNPATNFSVQRSNSQIIKPHVIEPKPERRPTRHKRWLSLGLRVGLSGLLLAYLLSRLNGPQLLASVNNIDWRGWFLAFAIALLSQTLSGLRWAGLAQPIGFRLPRWRFQQLYFEGMFFSLCLPSSIGGDVIKAVRLGHDGRSRALAACTVVADRLAGLVAVLLIGLTALAQRAFDLTLAATALVAIAGLAVALIGTRIVFSGLGWAAAQLSHHPHVGGFLQRLLLYDHHPYVFWIGIGWGLLVQGLGVVVVMALGFALQLDLPIQAYCVSVPLVALMTALPISLAGVGVREGGLVWLLSGYGLTGELGMALGLLWTTVTMSSGLVGGLVYLFGPPLDRQELDEAESLADETATIDNASALCAAVELPS